MLSILYEDPYFLAINKAAGIHSVSLPESSHNSIAAQILKLNPLAARNSRKPEDAGLINRLDFDTSGLLLAAKDIQSWETFHQHFLNGAVEKRYYALVEGIFSKRVEIENYIGTPNRRAQKVKVYKQKPAASARALPAHSIFELKQPLLDKQASLIEIIALSGRRHQIRAHAKFCDHPLIGDKLYGSLRNLQEIFTSQNDLPAFFLHAYSYSFVHPYTSKELILKAELPSYAVFNKVNAKAGD